MSEIRKNSISLVRKAFVLVGKVLFITGKVMFGWRKVSWKSITFLDVSCQVIGYIQYSVIKLYNDNTYKQTYTNISLTHHLAFGLSLMWFLCLDEV